MRCRNQGGGIDKAGVLERLGAALKSLSRAKRENPKAITLLIMYSVSMTEQTQNEIEAHRQEINHFLALESVLNSEKTRAQFFELLGI